MILQSVVEMREIEEIGSFVHQGKRRPCYREAWKCNSQEKKAPKRIKNKKGSNAGQGIPDEQIGASRNQKAMQFKTSYGDTAVHLISREDKVEIRDTPCVLGFSLIFKYFA